MFPEDGGEMANLESLISRLEGKQDVRGAQSLRMTAFTLAALTHERGQNNVAQIIEDAEKVHDFLLGVPSPPTSDDDQGELF